MKYDFEGKKEGWDFDGTICPNPEGHLAKNILNYRESFSFCDSLAST